jgi:hypothetical protein
VAHERSGGSLENSALVESFGRVVHRGHDSSFSLIGSCLGVARSYATRSTQLRRLAKQPVGRGGGGGPRSGGRPVRDRAVVGGDRRHADFQKRGGSVSDLNWDTAGSRKPWDTKRSPRQFEALDRNQSSVSVGQRLDRSSVKRTRSFQDLQLRRRGLEDVEAEGRFPRTPPGFRAQGFRV